MIVIDAGCSDRPGATPGSILHLIDRFHPDVLYGFDPNPDMDEADYSVGSTRVITEQKAAWTTDGFVGYEENGMRSQVGDALGPAAVPCFDLVPFITDLKDSRVILKLDVEGAEYTLLEHMLARGAAELCERILVEWHQEQDPDWGWRDSLKGRLRLLTELEEWWR